MIVARIRDGKIIASRDDHNHALHGEVLGELAEQLATTPSAAT